MKILILCLLACAVFSCSVDGDCSSGEVCDTITGTCTPECTNGFDCIFDFGLICRDGGCRSCGNNDDCPEHRPFCVNNKCVPCGKDSDCKDNQHCVAAFTTGDTHCTCKVNNDCKAITPECDKGICSECG